MNELLKMNLQTFSEPPVDPVITDPPADPVDPKVPEPKTFTQAEMEVIIKERVAREQKATDKKIEEAKKLATMNENDKKQYEFEQLQNELAELKRKDAYYGLSKEATKMLAEQSIHADDDLLAFVVKDDAEATKTAVNAFVGLINSKVEEGVKKALAGNSPRTHTQNTNTINKDTFNKMTYKEKVDMNQKNPDLYNQLTKGD